MDTKHLIAALRRAAKDGSLVTMLDLGKQAAAQLESLDSENQALRAELEWKEKVIELAQRKQREAEEKLEGAGKFTKRCDELLWNALKAHLGHSVSIVAYGDIDDPVDVCLECEDCGEVILDAELYTLAAREEN